MVYWLCGNRNITLSFFSPELCTLLACKQKKFPIFSINKTGSVQAGNIRAGSLKGAVDFAQAWKLADIVVLSDPFAICPRLRPYAKESGLVFEMPGILNIELECALLSLPRRFKERTSIAFSTDTSWSRS